MATRLADAERMIQACEQSGSALVINHNRRFNPDFRELAGRLGNVGTHFIDAVLMLTRSTVKSVSATLDLAGRPDCRGAEFRDPGGWGLLQLQNNTMVHLHAPDYSNSPAELTLHGTLGRACVVGRTVKIEKWNSTPETLAMKTNDSETSMDQAVREIVQWLDDGTPICCAPEVSRHTLEVILACHASHARRGAWTDLPLTGVDRELEVQSG